MIAIEKKLHERKIVLVKQYTILKNVKLQINNEKFNAYTTI